MELPDVPSADTTYTAPAPPRGGTPLAVVTGASSGIGAATARKLAASGYTVVLAARRAERIEPLAAELGGHAVVCDVTDAEQVAALADAVRGLGAGALDVLVNNAGGAFGSDPVAEADVDAWRAMYETNVIGTLQVTKALLPLLEASGAGAVLNVGSTAGRIVYEGGGGYTSAKHGTQVLTETLRLELWDKPVRVMTVEPGMVQTEEFSLVRFAGDSERAAKVYEGVKQPLVAEDVADAIAWMVTRPAHVNVDSLMVRPRAQAAQHKVHREA
ncbi:SDR family NAD(P)-dependent oxidoreductase [Nocardioides sp. GY 10127]|uniref:SDR family NAD(P)-dependent oxidoreductase n=1 Tax=Nocardioides sp. GY 10127 TaxID=2569762 RepID=UPI0010A93BAF|nr:SDR family NAD(P)-dependent oxidoreductase [Nocardioides sp. GY 10127]TIC78920.1 SDR family NAD(P)-dependent oxidoreductase [Nocardioides sp. GY 10127]